jgi:hypothetical protein
MFGRWSSLKEDIADLKKGIDDYKHFIWEPKMSSVDREIKALQTKIKQMECSHDGEMVFGYHNNPYGSFAAKISYYIDCADCGKRVRHSLTGEQITEAKRQYHLKLAEKHKKEENEPKTKENKMEEFDGYKKLKPIILHDLFLTKELCVSWKVQLVKEYDERYGFQGEIPLNIAIPFAQSKGKLDWLIEKGFVEKIKEERTYSVGEHFSIEDNLYILRERIPEEVELVNLRTGLSRSGALQVRNPTKITEKEFQRIIGIHAKIEDVKKVYVGFTVGDAS